MGSSGGFAGAGRPQAIVQLLNQNSPQQQGDGLVHGDKDLVQDELILILGAGDKEHKVANELVADHDVLKHNHLRCKALAGSVSSPSDGLTME